ncbi:Coagulation factor 5 8 type domain-containing protein [Pleurostoma richardsiae]|uniref:Coagulation factor 5 8 type domain-containing protein n=1 Tax=Pleurostoma richardsiae TaxID=41990 RepID=A0AA38RA26_9PEZI|nr:Coagulation factor 5 8 type domain-containing protein [Pleurostoma richardsiae]
MKQGFCSLLLLCLPLAGAAPSGGPYRRGLSQAATSFDSRAVNALPGQPNYTSIPNGQAWYDTDGNAIDAHGGGFLKVDDWYYWVGESFSTGVGPPYDDAHVKMYKSQDLMNWEYVGAVITVYTPDINGNHLLTYCTTERPKLVYNKATNKYVLWVHWEMSASYDPSQLFVATADNVEGPYTLTAKGHFRPGSGNQDSSAMGDRVGGLNIDYNSSPKNSANTSRPYKPVSGSDYPPKVLQFSSTVDPSNPEKVTYLSQSSGYGEAQIDNWWTYELTGVYFNMTLKAIAVKMTTWDVTYYEMYSPYWSLDTTAYDYILRYPTNNRSEVATYAFEMGDPGNERTALVAPDIHPGLDESSSNSVVYVHSGDAAFVTCNTTDSTVYYTTDGSTPTTDSSVYYTGTRISVTGSTGYNMTVKAICTLNNQTSSIISQTYVVVDNTTAVPIFRPVVSIPPGTYEPNDAAFGYAAVKIYCPTYNTECYYTMDGLDPDPPVLGTNIGYRSRDLTIWQDPKDGNAYLFTASDNIYNRVWALTDDYTDVVADKEYDVFVDVSREAPALIRNGGASGEYVYLITSTQSGWFPNQAQYIRTADVKAGFNEPRDSTTGYRNGNMTWSGMEPVGDPSTYYSQSTFILDIGTDDDPQYVFVGDRYDTNELFDSTYVFMPLTVDDDAAAVTGDTGSGLMTLQYEPELVVDIANNSIVPPTWKLLSLNKPVTATSSVALTAAEIAAGTYNFSASVANDGIDYDVGPYDSVEQYYQPTQVPFYWQVDLEEAYELAWIGLSFMSVGGSDAVNRYKISASTDGSYFYPLVDNTGNLSPGYMAHVLSGSYRYVRMDDYSVWDVDHNKEADWEVGVYEISVYGYESGSNTTTSSTTATSSATATSSLLTSSSATATATTTGTAACNHDNCLREFLRSTSLINPFCATYTAAVNTATSGLPSYVSQCQSSPSRISSACSCVMTAMV